MSEELLRLQKDISSLPHSDNLVSIVVYGSIITNESKAQDLDIIVVVQKVNTSLSHLFKLLYERYSTIDFNVYSYAEILSTVSFYTREFKLEYLQKGLCIYGANIFQDEFLKVDANKYRRSILIRSIEYLQMVRQKYFSRSLTDAQKFEYLKKYFLRICKSILLFCGRHDHSSVNKMTQVEILEDLVAMRVFDTLPDIESIENKNDLFNLFSIISDALMKCKKEFDSEQHASLPF